MNFKKLFLGATILAGGGFYFHQSAAGMNFETFKRQILSNSKIMKSFASRDGQWLGTWQVLNPSAWNPYERSRCDLYTVSDDGSTVIIIGNGIHFALGRPQWGDEPGGTIALTVGDLPYGTLNTGTSWKGDLTGLSYVSGSLSTSGFGLVGRAIQFWSQMMKGGAMEFRFSGILVSKHIDPLSGNFARGVVKECYEMVDRFGR